MHDRSAAESARLAIRALRVAQSHLIDVSGDEMSTENEQAARLMWREIHALSMRLEAIERETRIARARELAMSATLK